MAGLTFSELQDEVLFNSFSERYRTRVARYLNDAVREVCRRTNQIQRHIAYDPINQSALLDAIGELYRVSEVWTATGSGEGTSKFDRRLTPLQESGANVTALGDSGEARFYQAQPYVGNEQSLLLTYYPTTPAYVGIVGHFIPPPMSEDSDLSGLGAEFDQLLIAYARMRAFQAEDDFQAAAGWKAEYDRALASLQHIQSPQEGPIITPGTWDE